MERKLPEGWRKFKVRDICILINGRAFKSREWSDRGLPIIRIQNLNDSNAEFNFCNFRVEDKYIIENGDLLFAWSGTPGTSFGAHIWNRGQGVLNQHIFKVIIKSENIDRQYLMKFLNYNINLYIDNAHGSTGLAHITKNKLDESIILLPPIETQRRIVAILDKAEEIRRLRAQAYELVGRLQHSVFLELFGDPATNPKNWVIEPLRNFISFITSGSRGWAKFYSNSGSKFIRVQNLTGHKLNFEKIAFVLPSDTAETRRTKIEPGDLLISITGIVGLVAVAPFDIDDAYVSQHVAILRLNKSIDPYFVAAFLSNPTGGQVQLLKQQYGQTKPGLGLKDIESIKILVPPIELQKRFATILEEINAMSNKIKSSEIECNNLAHTLLEKAFNGELVA